MQNLSDILHDLGKSCAHSPNTTSKSTGTAVSRKKVQTKVRLFQKKKFRVISHLLSARKKFIVCYHVGASKKKRTLGMGELSSSKNIHSHDRIYRWKHKKIVPKRTGRKKFSNHAWHEIKINVSDSIRTEAKWVKFILWALLFVLRCKLAGWVWRLKSRSRDKYFLRQQMTSAVELYDSSVGVWLQTPKSRRLPRFQPSRADPSSRFTICRARFCL